MTIAPEGRRLLRLEARNAETPIERKPPWIKTRLRTGPEYTELNDLVRTRGPAHGVPGGRLPQHLRVLGRPRGHLPDRRRRVHPALRLLPDRHRQAAAARPRRAAPGRRVGGDDGPALRHRHRRRPRRPARRGRLAVRRDGPRDPRGAARLRRRAADPRLLRASPSCSAQVFDSAPEVLAHNVETVPRIFRRIRPGFRYERSLDVLTQARAAGLVTKSNLILGMGETREESARRCATCTTRAATCSRSPSTCARPPRHHPVSRWVKPEEFVDLAAEAEQIGFAGVMSGPLVRSSYRAGRLYAQAMQARGATAS